MPRLFPALLGLLLAAGSAKADCGN